jgi:hypothetical protein
MILDVLKTGDMENIARLKKMLFYWNNALSGSVQY